MPEIKINLTSEEKANIEESLGTITIEEYIKAIANNHETQKLDEEFKGLTKSEKKIKLGK